jgi:hypothetical protein
MPQVRFQPTIPEFEQAKKVHALHRAATVIAVVDSYYKLIGVHYCLTEEYNESEKCMWISVVNGLEIKRK